MNVNGIGKQNYYETAGTNKANPKNGGGFYESLSENINEKAEAQQKKDNSVKAKGVTVTAAYSYCGVSAGNGASGVRKSEKAGSDAIVKTDDVRHISYQESDYVKAYAVQGYTLMAQVDLENRKVYIERRQEDGTLTGYEVDIDKLNKETVDPVGRAAMEAWEKKISDTQDADGEQITTMAEALLSFYEFIEDRIKNGPPKYMIGNTEFSVAEWDKLLEGIDNEIDTVKEELRERIEKLKEQQVKAESSQETLVAQTDLRDAENEKIEEELLSSLFKDMSTI